MDKKTIDTLRVMLCGEIDDIAKKGNIGTHENLDILKDLVETEKNLVKIEKYTKEMEEGKEMDYDSGYSQRKYYIDADYQPPMGPNSYARGGMGGRSYMDGNSYGRGRGMYDMGGQSYGMYYDPRYEQGWSMTGGYSRGMDKHEAIDELQKMMGEVKDEPTKMALQKALTDLKK